MFVVQSKNLFSTSIENHNIDTRQRNNLYLPPANLTIYQKAAYYSGIKIFNNLLLEIKNVTVNQKKFKIALKKCSYTYSFYTMEEYLSQTWIMYCITRFLIILVLVLRFYLCTSYKYSKIVYYELITFPCINLTCLIYVQCVPLTTKPGISLIILTPMKILQQTLKRSMFVVWEIKRNVSVVRLIVATRSSGPPASQVR